MLKNPKSDWNFNVDPSATLLWSYSDESRIVWMMEQTEPNVASICTWKKFSENVTTVLSAFFEEENKKLKIPGGGWPYIVDPSAILMWAYGDAARTVWIMEQTELEELSFSRWTKSFSIISNSLSEFFDWKTRQ